MLWALAVKGIPCDAYAHALSNVEMIAFLDRIDRALSRIDRACAGSRIPILLFALALVLKFAFVWFTRDALYVLVPTMDARYYDQMAQDIARGNVLRHDAFFMGPLYPYFLASLYSTLGRDFTVVRLLQATGGAFTVLLVFLIGRRVFRPSVALIGASLLILHGAMTFYETELLMEWLGALLNCIALWLLVRKPGLRGYAAAGGILGISALARASILVFALVVVVWLLRGGARRNFSRAAAFSGALLVAISPAIVHNFVVSRDVVPITSNAGMNFYVGNSRNADGTFVLIHGVDVTSDVTTSEYVERAIGRVPTPSEVSSYWFGRAMEDVRKDPARTLQLMARKVALFFNGWEVPQIECFDIQRRDTPMLQALFVRSWFVCVMGILGMALAFRAAPTSRLLTGYVLAYAVSIVLFFVTGRYRSQVIPILCVFAGFALVTLPTLARHGRSFAGAILAIVLLTLATSPALFRLDSNMLQFRDEVHRARRLSELRRYAPALAAADSAIAIYPKEAEGYVHRAIVHKQAGEEFKAIEDYNRALERDPADAVVHYDLAQAFRRVNLNQKAVDEYGLAVRNDPAMAQAYNNLGITLREMGRVDEAANVFQRAIDVFPRYTKVYNNLGALYAETGKTEDAIRVFEDTTRKFPEYANGFKNLAMAYASQKRVREALPAMRRYVELQPSDTAAKEVVRKLEIAVAADTTSAN